MSGEIFLHPDAILRSGCNFYRFFETVLFGNFVLAFEPEVGDVFLNRSVFDFLVLILAAVRDSVYNDTHNHRKRERGYLNKRAVGERVVTEVERYAADTDYEDCRDGIEVAVVREVDVFEHLKSAYRDESVHRDARAAHYAFGQHIDYCNEGRKEGYYHAEDSGREDRIGRSVFGKRDAAYRFAVSRVCAASEERAYHRAYAVAEKRIVETGIFEKVNVYDVGEVLVIGYMLGKFYHRDGHEQNRKVTDCRAVERVRSVGADRLKESELRIIEETLESERAEAVNDRGEVHDSHTHTEFAVVDVTERGDYERKPESRADTHDERYKFDALSAFNRRYDDRDESEQAHEHVPEIIFASAVVHHPAACGAGKRKSDDREDRSDDYVREEFFDPAGADEFDYKSDDHVYESRKNYADNQAPVTVVLSGNRLKRAEERERRSEEYRAFESREKQIHDRSETRSEHCRRGVALKPLRRYQNRYEQGCRHDRDHLLEREHEVLSERRSLLYLVNHVVHFLYLRNLIFTIKKGSPFELPQN